MKIILSLFLACSLLGELGSEEIDKPNVLLIAVDDLNDWIGCLDGHPQTFTPNIDRLAQGGLKFGPTHRLDTASRVDLIDGHLAAKATLTAAISQATTDWVYQANFYGGRLRQQKARCAESGSSGTSLQDQTTGYTDIRRHGNSSMKKLWVELNCSIHRTIRYTVQQSFCEVKRRFLKFLKFKVSTFFHSD